MKKRAAAYAQPRQVERTVIQVDQLDDAARKRLTRELKHGPAAEKRPRKTAEARTDFRREDAEQAALFEWAARVVGRLPEVAWLFHPANGEKRDLGTARKLKRMGVRPGVPDVLLLIPRGGYTGLAIELKVGDNRPTTEQRRWHAFLRLQGFRVEVSYSWQAAARILVEYLGANPADVGLYLT